MKGLVHLHDDSQAYAQSKLALTIWREQGVKMLKSPQAQQSLDSGAYRLFYRFIIFKRTYCKGTGVYRFSNRKVR
jgi:hypothetical protein